MKHNQENNSKGPLIKVNPPMKVNPGPAQEVVTDTSPLPNEVKTTPLAASRESS